MACGCSTSVCLGTCPQSRATPILDCLPSCADVGPSECSTDAIIDSCTFELCDKESGLFDCIAQEHVSISGTEIELFHLSIDDSSRDPLYDEAIERVFQGSYVMKVYLEYPEANSEANEWGLHKDWDAEVWIPRAEIERVNAPVPVEDDVVRVWNTPFFKKFSVIDQDIPDSGYFFSITKVVEDGHIFDRSSFVGFKCTLKRSTEYTAERRMISD